MHDMRADRQSSIEGLAYIWADTIPTSTQEVIKAVVTILRPSSVGTIPQAEWAMMMQARIGSQRHHYADYATSSRTYVDQTFLWPIAFRSDLQSDSGAREYIQR